MTRTLAILLLLSGCAHSYPPIREITLAGGTVIYGKCGIPYYGAVRDTMPPGTACLDWEMRRAGMEPMILPQVTKS